jgi:hypothetical protein
MFILVAAFSVVVVVPEGATPSFVGDHGAAG